MNLNSNALRSLFLNYFQKYQHKILPSASLIPKNDPTLLFTNSGMVPFKNYFTGESLSRYPRIATTQKCLRAGGKHNDLDNVGYTTRHHTFFEMLGNFSFADYGKEEAILYAWLFLTKELNIKPNKLLITVYHTDLESYHLWKKISNLPNECIIKINTQDNFWTMGTLGPCGPSSEIFYDYGAHLLGSPPGSKEDTGNRFLEIWNLVFMEKNKTNTGLYDLPHSCIDTGMGLERIASVMQNKYNNFETDLFSDIIDASVSISGRPAVGQDLFSHRIIADHLRASSFLIADGVLPSNEHAGYVLRRIMRRSMLHSYFLGIKNTLTEHLFPIVQKNMGNHFNELYTYESLIINTLKIEENRFFATLNHGIERLKKIISNIGSQKVLNGDLAFSLHDTYGFPIDLTIEFLKKYNLSVDMKGFEHCMQLQKERGKRSWKGSLQYNKLTQENRTSEKTIFLGYEQLNTKAIIQDINYLEDTVLITTNQTTFYPEGGGQASDKGFLEFNNQSFPIIDCKKTNDQIVHILSLHPELSYLKKGEIVTLIVDSDIRYKHAAGHTGTHLLHTALRKILGAHILQKGSSITKHGLRFDFNHNSPLTVLEKQALEKEVNQYIIQAIPVSSRYQNYQESIKQGAISLPGITYDSEVRVIDINSISKELCGGTHVKNTKDILLFKIISESSISSGIRRIEAKIGPEAINHVIQQTYYLEKLTLLSGQETPENYIHSLTKKNKQLEQKNKQLLLTLITSKNPDVVLYNKTLISQENYLYHYDLKININFKFLLEKLIHTHHKGIFIITYKNTEQVTVSIGIKNLSISAKALLAHILPIIQGKGGGNEWFASGSGKSNKLQPAIDTLIEFLKHSI